MAEVHLDHPGEVSWWAGHGPLPVIGPCPHVCEHCDMRMVAYGPDYERYELAECRDAEGCAGRCRVWVAEYPPEYGKPRLHPHHAMQVRHQREVTG